MLEHNAVFRLTRMAVVLNVSRSGYYAWLNASPSPRQVKQEQRDAQVKAAFERSKQRDGAVRIQSELDEAGDKADIKTIRDSMKRQGLVAKAARLLKSPPTASTACR